MFTFSISLAVLLSVALLLSEKKLQVEADACTSNSDCSHGFNYYCCKQRYWYQGTVCHYGGCVGQSCSSKSDCGGTGECCLNNTCTKSGCSECSSNFDCGLNEYCCKQRYYYQKHVCGAGGCVGEPCRTDSDCGGILNECCSKKYCTKSGCYKTTASPIECSSNSDCAGYNKSCCKQRYYWQSNVCGDGGCVGQSCSSNSDCGGTGECCLNNVCTKSGCPECSSNLDCSGLNEYCCKQRYSYQENICGSGGCVGQPCSSDSDCGGPGECCSSTNYCTQSFNCFHDVTKALASWVIGVIVVSVLAAVVIPIAIIACFCCCGVASASRGPAYRGVVVTQPTTSATVIALQNSQTVQNNPAQFQSSPYPPPPAYSNQDQNVPSTQFETQVPPPAYKY